MRAERPLPPGREHFQEAGQAELVICDQSIEAAFAPAKGRTRKTKGAGSRQAGLSMAFKLIESAQQRWRKINAPHLVPLVRAGVRFPEGKREAPARREEALIAA